MELIEILVREGYTFNQINQMIKLNDILMKNKIDYNLCYIKKTTDAQKIKNTYLFLSQFEKIDVERKISIVQLNSLKKDITDYFQEKIKPSKLLSIIRLSEYIDIEEAKKYDNAQLVVLYDVCRSGLDYSKLLNEKLNQFQMIEIFLGLKEGLDVSIYNNPEITSKKMKEIRKKLTENKDFEDR